MSSSIVPCFIEAADRLIKTGKLEQARYCYIQALQLEPNSAELNLKLGSVLHSLGKVADAIASFQKVVEIKPDFWEGYHCLGDAWRQQEKWEAAVNAYRQATALNPQFYWSHYHLGSALFQLQQWQEAIICYQQAIELQPNFWEGYHALGDSRRKLEHYENAIEAYRGAIALNSNFFWSHYNLGIMLLKVENWSEAIASLNRAKEIDPDYPPLSGKLASALQFQGNFYLKQSLNYYQQAVKHNPDPELLLSALQIEPGNFQLCKQLGQFLIKQERFKLLIEQYQTTLQYTPDTSQHKIYGDLYYDLGIAWLSQGNFDKAIALWQTTLEYSPRHIEANLELASLMLKEGRLQQAKNYYSNALNLDCDRETKDYCQYVIDRLSDESKKDSSKPVHIILYTDCPQFYGAEQSSHMLMKGLVKAGYRVTCMQSRADHHLIEARKKLGIKHFWVSAENVDCIADYQNYFRPRLPSTLYDASEAAKSFAITKPDLIIFSDACVMSNLVPKQVGMHLNIPFMTITHRVHSDARSQFAPYIHLLPAIYQQVQDVVVVSQNNLDLLHQEFGLDPAKGKVIYNGISDRFFAPKDLTTRQRIRQELEIPLDAIVISTNARLDIEKGYQFQLQAIEQLQQTELWSQLYFVWSGSGGYSASLQAEVLRLNVGNRVKFLGSRQDIPDLLDAADIFLMPSLYEGMPIAITEAMAKGIPVIATSVSGIPEQLADTGKLLPDPKIDPQATVNELVTTIQNWSCDRQLRLEKGQACQQRAKSMFSEQQMIEQHRSLMVKHLSL